jgi:hypothetical protein
MVNILVCGLDVLGLPFHRRKQIDGIDGDEH